MYEVKKTCEHKFHHSLVIFTHLWKNIAFTANNCTHSNFKSYAYIGIYAYPTHQFGIYIMILMTRIYCS